MESKAATVAEAWAALQAREQRRARLEGRVSFDPTSASHTPPATTKSAPLLAISPPAAHVSSGEEVVVMRTQLSSVGHPGGAAHAVITSADAMSADHLVHTDRTTLDRTMPGARVACAAGEATTGQREAAEMPLPTRGVAEDTAGARVESEAQRQRTTTADEVADGENGVAVLAEEGRERNRAAVPVPHAALQHTNEGAAVRQIDTEATTAPERAQVPHAEGHAPEICVKPRAGLPTAEAQDHTMLASATPTLHVSQLERESPFPSGTHSALTTRAPSPQQTASRHADDEGEGVARKRVLSIGGVVYPWATGPMLARRRAMEARRQELLASDELAAGAPRACMEWTALLAARDKLLRLQIEPMASLRHPMPLLADDDEEEEVDVVASMDTRRFSAAFQRLSPPTNPTPGTHNVQPLEDTSNVQQTEHVAAGATTALSAASSVTVTASGAAETGAVAATDSAESAMQSVDGTNTAANALRVNPVGPSPESLASGHTSPDNDTYTQSPNLATPTALQTERTELSSFASPASIVHSPLTARLCIECAARGRRTPFTPFRGRHLCANCGQAVCGRCCGQRVLLPGAQDRAQRVCDSCHRRLTQQPAATCVRTVDSNRAERVYWLVELPATLWRMHGLVELHLESTHLAVLPAAVGQLRALRVLNLAGNRLTRLPAALGQLTELTALLVRDNSITHLPAACAGLVRLTRLDLARNTLAAVPEWLERLVALEHLDLSQNVGMDKDSLAYLSGLPAVTHLHLRYLHLSATPRALWTLPALQYLNLNHNRLTELPPGIGALTHLSELRLGDNRLASLPVALGHLENLRVLVLSGNDGLSLPRSVGRLRQLRQLALAGCALTELPACLGNLTALEALELQDNGLTGLPVSFARLTNLTTLVVHNNPCHNSKAWTNPHSLLRLLARGDGTVVAAGNGSVAEALRGDGSAAEASVPETSAATAGSTTTARNVDAVSPSLPRQAAPTSAAPTAATPQQASAVPPPSSSSSSYAPLPPPLSVLIWPVDGCPTGQLYECLADDALLHAQPDSDGRETLSNATTPTMPSSPASSFGIAGQSSSVDCKLRLIATKVD